MKRVKVLIPFHSKALNKDLVPDDVIEVNDEQLANIRSVNVNMVVELGEAEPKAKPKAKAKAEPKANK